MNKKDKTTNLLSNRLTCCKYRQDRLSCLLQMLSKSFPPFYRHFKGKKRNRTEIRDNFYPRIFKTLFEDLKNWIFFQSSGQTVFWFRRFKSLYKKMQTASVDLLKCLFHCSILSRL